MDEPTGHCEHCKPGCGGGKFDLFGWPMKHHSANTTDAWNSGKCEPCAADESAQMDERTRLVALFEAERESHGASDEPYHVGYWEALGWAIEELGYSA